MLLPEPTDSAVKTWPKAHCIAARSGSLLTARFWPLLLLLLPVRFQSIRIAVGWAWLLAAALIPAGLLLMTNALSWALLGLHPRSVVRGWQILWSTAMAVGANVWEEVGWRAYAMRRLENVMQPWLPALIVGIFWAGWHVPLFLSNWSGMTQIPFGLWALRILATSVIMAWLYNRTGGSLWAVTVFHVGSNVWAAWTGVWSHWVEAIVVWMVAAFLLSCTRGRLGRSRYSRVRFPAAAGVSGVSKDLPLGPSCKDVSHILLFVCGEWLPPFVAHGKKDAEHDFEHADSDR